MASQSVPGKHDRIIITSVVIFVLLLWGRPRLPAADRHAVYHLLAEIP